MLTTRMRSLYIALAVCAMTVAVFAQQRAGVAPAPRVSENGSVTVPPFELPFSSFASQEARAAFASRLRTPPPAAGTAVGLPDIATRREMSNKGLQPVLDAFTTRHPHISTKSKVGNVSVETFLPNAGIAPENKDRVLISIHGGGFNSGGGGVGGAVETVPISGIGRIKVITVDYRLLPEHTMQDAVDDIVTVYRDVLRSYRPENIGLYGCSAGGALAGWATTALMRQKLPLPGAIGVFCASLHGFTDGDSAQLWPRLGSVIRNVPPPSDKPAPRSPLDPTTTEMRTFPPTLFLTGTRAFDMSGAVQSHLELQRLGVESHLLLFDGMDHGFFVFQSNLPETQQAHELIARFFTTHLGAKRTDRRRN